MGIFELLRRTDLSNASVTSAFVSSPDMNFTSRPCQVSASDFPAWNGGGIETPRESAHRRISQAVRGPQFRVAIRRLAVISRSNALEGVQFSRGGHSPVISSANNFRTFKARTLSPQGRAPWTEETSPRATEVFSSVIPERPTDRRYKRTTFTCFGNSAGSRSVATFRAVIFY
jgi:hypothetical protein